MNMRVLTPLLVLFLAFVPARADDMDEVRTRMEQRLPEINAMKQRQEVGENNRGYLDILKSAANAEQVAGENADRRRVYDQIAASTGTTSEAVGRQRARQIAERSAPGIMLQDERGNWYEKR